MATSSLSTSVSQLSASNFFDKPLLWADSSVWIKFNEPKGSSNVDSSRTASASTSTEKSMVSKFTLRLPRALDLEYFSYSFERNVWIIRLVDYLGIFLILNEQNYFKVEQVFHFNLVIRHSDVTENWLGVSSW